MAIKKTILSAVIGSHAHGLQTDKSDLDIIEVYIAPTVEMFDIYNFTQKQTKQTFQGNVDIFSAELNHFVRGALKGNPKFLEVLWSPIELEKTDEGRALKKVREAFLSQQIVPAFKGITSSMVSKYHKNGNIKNLRNAVYMVDLFQHLWTTNEVFLEIEDLKLFHDKVESYKIDPGILVEHIQDFSEKVYTDIPELPEIQVIQNVVDKIRIKNLPLHMHLNTLYTKEVKI